MAPTIAPRLIDAARFPVLACFLQDVPEEPVKSSVLQGPRDRYGVETGPAIAEPSRDVHHSLLTRPGSADRMVYAVAEMPLATPVTKALTELMRLLSGHTNRTEEARILVILRTLSDADFDAVLTRLDLNLLFRALDDHLGGPAHNTALLRLVCEERVIAVSTSNRARVIFYLQQGITAAKGERAIKSLFLATHGLELTRLKNTIDRGGNGQDLSKLIYDDVDNAGMRAEILAHIKKEAEGMGGLELRLLSDIDDTLYCNWVDKRYPKGAVYPGARAFYKEVARCGKSDRETWGGANLTFISARPNDPTGSIEDNTHAKLRKLGIPEAVVLSGDLTSIAGNEEIAAKKYENFLRYQRLFPEYRFMFVGDSGQGDALAAVRMRENHTALVPLTLIHDVVVTSRETRASQTAKGIVYFDTYILAAWTAHEHGLLDDDGLKRVIAAALAELEAIPFADPAQRAHVQALFYKDLDVVEEGLGGSTF